jgi:hypothetical protein
MKVQTSLTVVTDRSANAQIKQEITDVLITEFMPT